MEWMLLPSIRNNHALLVAHDVRLSALPDSLHTSGNYWLSKFTFMPPGFFSRGKSSERSAVSPGDMGGITVLRPGVERRLKGKCSTAGLSGADPDNGRIDLAITYCAFGDGADRRPTVPFH